MYDGEDEQGQPDTYGNNVVHEAWHTWTYAQREWHNPATGPGPAGKHDEYSYETAAHSEVRASGEPSETQ